MRQINPREQYLLRFLRTAEVINLPLAHALLAPKAERKGQATRGFASSPRNSYVWVMLRRFVKEGVLRRHPYEQAYLLGRKVEQYLPDDARVRSLTRSNPGLGKVKHDLLTTHILVTLDLACQAHPRWQYTVLEDGKEPLLHAGRRVKLDKAIQLTDTQEGYRHNWFVESDRATAALTTHLPRKRNIQDKVKLLTEYSGNGGWDEFGLKGARVLFLVPQEKKGRAEAIMRTVSEAAGGTILFKATPVHSWHLEKPLTFVEWLIT